ncbi:MAG: PKD domain-containing protein [Bacteroidia bacterium]
MKLQLKISALLQGKIHYYFTLLSFLFISMANAQTTPCRTGFDVKIDHESKTVKLNAKSNMTPVKFLWDFGDGTSERGSEVKHTYTNPGKYKICVKSIAFNSSTNQRCTVQVCKTVRIVDCDRLKGEFAYEVDGLSIKVRGKSNSNIAAAGYSFGDSTIKRGYSAKHTYSKPGTYSVCMILKDTVYGCKTTICKRITIARPGCQLEGDFKFTNNGFGLKLQAKSNQDKVHYFWSFGDGEDATGKNTSHRYKKPGLYQVCLIIFNPKTKCKVCICKRVLIEKPCNLKANFQMRTDSTKVWVRARSNASNNSLYYWSFGDGTKKRGKFAKHKYSSPGLYKVTLLVVDKRRDCKTMVEKRVIIGRNRTSTLTQSPSPSFEPSENELNNENDNQAPMWNASVSPSPAKESVSLSSSDKTLSTVVITDMSGTVVVDQTSSLSNIDVTNLSHGIYYAKITAADGSQKTIRFIKN